MPTATSTIFGAFQSLFMSFLPEARGHSRPDAGGRPSASIFTPGWRIAQAEIDVVLRGGSAQSTRRTGVRGRVLVVTICHRGVIAGVAPFAVILLFLLCSAFTRSGKMCRAVGWSNKIA